MITFVVGTGPTHADQHIKNISAGTGHVGICSIETGLTHADIFSKYHHMDPKFPGNGYFLSPTPRMLTLCGVLFFANAKKCKKIL